jgi:signal transduction histidine kinase
MPRPRAIAHAVLGPKIRGLAAALLPCIHLMVAAAPIHRLTSIDPASFSSGEELTLASQVTTLSVDEARRPYRAKLRGIVTSSNANSCVVEDASGSVYVLHAQYAWPTQPLEGEVWEFSGGTDPGEFSPIVIALDATRIGEGSLPPAIQATREQLINGSLDVKLIELAGIVLGSSAEEVTLLMPGGPVRIVAHPSYPLPRPSFARGPDWSEPGTLVRVRGVYFTFRDPATQHLIPGRFLLGNGTVSVEAPPPADPFAGPARSVAELLRFNRLSHCKVAGQVVHGRPGEYFIFDGTAGFRALTNIAYDLAEGDLVEVVGYPQLGGPSPILLEAMILKTGAGPRPEPRLLEAAELADERNDATLVQVEAQLVANLTTKGERVLEVQSGQHVYLARLRAPETLPRLRPGAQLILTGVYASIGSSTRGATADMELLLNRPSDIVVVKNGPWWTQGHTLAALGSLVAGLFASLTWVGLLRRTVAHRTALLSREIHQREQVEKRRLLEQERARVAQDLHDDLGAGLAQIGLIGAMAQRTTGASEGAHQQLSQITAKAREMVTSLDEIVWAIDPKHDTTGSVAGYLCDYTQEFLRPTGIVCRFDISCPEPSRTMGSHPRHQLFLAFKEALTNVVKHAGATEVWVRFASDDRAFEVIMEDNGKGISATDQSSRGNGILNLRARLEKIGGRCEIQPRPGGGTRVSLRLPVDQLVPA